MFEGPALDSGRIKADLLAEALLGSSQIFGRANGIVNGPTSTASVLVQSDFKTGSFVVELQLVHDIVGEIGRLIGRHPAASATVLAVIIGFIRGDHETIKESLIDLFKWLKGRKPDSSTSIDNTNVEVTLGQNRKVVSTQVFNLYGDSAIRSALEKLTAPLRSDAVDRIALKHGGTEQAAIEKQEAPYFQSSSGELTAAESPMDGERDTVLIVSKLSFKEGSTWTFFERGAVVVAKIEDEGFWSDIHQHRLTFGEGDMLRVRLHWTIERTDKLRQKNVVVKVYELIERPKQMRLGDG